MFGKEKVSKTEMLLAGVIVGIFVERASNFLVSVRNQQARERLLAMNPELARFVEAKKNIEISQAAKEFRANT